MLYPKNVPNIERLLRVALGIILVGAVILGQPVLGSFTPLAIGLSLVSAIFVLATGFVGWCPACAMVGRKLKTKAETQKQG